MLCSALPQIHDMIGWEILWSREEEHIRVEPRPKLSWWDEQKKRAGVPIIMWPATTLPASPSFALVLRAAVHPGFLYIKICHNSRFTLFTDKKFMYYESVTIFHCLFYSHGETPVVVSAGCIQAECWADTAPGWRGCEVMYNCVRHKKPLHH